MTITRRQFIRGLGAVFTVPVFAGAYAAGLEPFRLRIQSYRLRPDNWTKGLRIKIVALADIHACRPWMSPERIAGIVETANALKPDVAVLLGDYTAGHRMIGGHVASSEWAEALSTLSAPLGVYAILGNHDWWDDRTAQRAGGGPTVSRIALEKVGFPVLENDAVRVEKNGLPFWVAGLGDQLALLSGIAGRRRMMGVHDLAGTLAKVTDEAPVVLLAHEPDIFLKVPPRVALTLSGHTHGGQIRLFGYSPVVPSSQGNRYAYGHVREVAGSGGVRHMIVSGGLGCSIAPIRFGVPPEIVTIDVG